jgi:phosphomannomutase
VLGEEVTFPRLRAAAWACARWIVEQERGTRVVVGYDTRFASEAMARMLSAVLVSEGLDPLLSASWIPTPVLCRALLEQGAAAGLMLTASHNPSEYHGLKVFSASGGAVLDSDAKRIESLAASAPQRCASELACIALERADFVPSYVEALLAELDRDALRRGRLSVVYDALHGAGSGVLDDVLRRAGASVRLLRGERDACFGGGVPDPTPGRLAGLARAVRRVRARRRIGLATDGDADRFGAVDAEGRHISETQGLALLVDHLARAGRISKGVVVSLATGSLVERVAEHHGLRVLRRSIGFKHLTTALCEGLADVAGEESGGFALARMGHDKDGILAGCMLAEIAAAARGGLRGRLTELESRFGTSACGREAVPVTSARLEALARLVSDPPEVVGRARVRAVSGDDGVRLVFDDGFLMWRRSGTEPVLRVYAEAAGPRLLRQRLERGVDLLASAEGS